MIFQMGSTFFFQKVNSVILMNAIPKKASKVLQALERILTNNELLNIFGFLIFA